MHLDNWMFATLMIMEVTCALVLVRVFRTILSITNLQHQQTFVKNSSASRTSPLAQISYEFLIMSSLFSYEQTYNKNKEKNKKIRNFTFPAHLKSLEMTFFNFSLNFAEKLNDLNFTLDLAGNKLEKI